MAIEKKKVEDAVEPTDFKALQLEFELMRKELAEQKKAGNPQQVGAGGLSPDQFSTLMAEMLKVSKNKEEDTASAYSYTKEENIDPDDFDEKGVIFCGYSTGYVIVDDVRNGHNVLPPFKKPILFGFMGMRKTRNQQGREVLNTFCSFTSKSKKEQKWLREHRYFGIKFFETHMEALAMDADKGQKLMHYVDVCMGYDQAQLMTLCKQFGVGIHSDVMIMRKNLAVKMLNSVEDVAKKASDKMLREMNEELLFKEDTSKHTAQTRK